MTSGAYHDAMVMGSRVPIGMIFVPSAGGISHHPDEHTDPDDLERGVQVLAGHAGEARGVSGTARACSPSRAATPSPTSWSRAGACSASSRASGSTATSRSPAGGSPASGATTAASGSTPRGRFVVPGLIDAHVHVESSKLLPAEFARVVVARGTTAVVCDPHELANVLGADGAHWMLDASSGLPLRVFVMAPSCVPASALESARGALGPDDMAGILRRGRALGVAEVMDFPSVIAGDPAVLEKVALHPHVDGHAPGVLGAELDAYAAAGIRSDHEATTWEEALEKRRRGLWVLLREASNARNLTALLELVRRHGPEYCAFCTDDREPDMLVGRGTSTRCAARRWPRGSRPRTCS